MKHFIYADNAATTQLEKDAFEAMKPFFLENYANPSGVYSYSKKAKQTIKAARKTIAECINAEPEQIFFTSGGTESDNWAIKGFALSDYDYRTVITSQIEHHAILNSCSAIERLRHPVAYLPVDSNGIVLADTLNKYISDQTGLVSIMAANNEIGTIEPIKELAQIAHSHGALFHTDAVQAFIPIDVKELGVDMLSASAHKFNGPKGIGFLYCKEGILQPYHNGGSQEYGMRAGTENVPAIVGMAVALRKNIAEMEKNANHLQHLMEVFFSIFGASSIPYILNGHQHNRLPGNINISIKGKMGEGLMHMLDLKGICVSTGSACDSHNQQVSHVIQAIGVPEDYCEGTIRITLGKHNTEEEVKAIAETLIKLSRI